MIEGSIVGLMIVISTFIGSITPPLIYMITQKTIAYKEMMKAESELMKERAKNERNRTSNK